jgi:putative flippase GtrA
MTVTQRLTVVIDWFYRRPFRALMPLQTFRYLACGGINFFVTIVCYAVAYNFIFAKQNLDLGLLVVSPHVAALGISLPINFFVGFWLQRSISFRLSPLRGRVQLFRYFATALAALLLNYGLTKLFVDVCHIFPTVAQVLIYCLTAILSFALQKHYTFRGAGKC